MRALQQLEQGEDALATQKHALALLRRHIAERAYQWIVERSMRFSIFITALPGSNQKRELKIAMQLAHRFETRGDNARAYEGYMRTQKSQPDASAPCTRWDGSPLNPKSICCHANIWKQRACNRRKTGIFSVIWDAHSVAWHDMTKRWTFLRNATIRCPMPLPPLLALG